MGPTASPLLPNRASPIAGLNDASTTPFTAASATLARKRHQAHVASISSLGPPGPAASQAAFFTLSGGPVFGVHSITLRSSCTKQYSNLPSGQATIASVVGRFPCLRGDVWSPAVVSVLFAAASRLSSCWL